MRMVPWKNCHRRDGGVALCMYGCELESLFEFERRRVYIFAGGCHFYIFSFN